MIVRFCEIAGKPTDGVCVTLPENVVSCNETDIIENDTGAKTDGNVITFSVPAYGFKTFRTVTSKAAQKVSGATAVSDKGTLISWNKTDGALYYEVFRMRENEKPMFLASTRNTNWYDSQVSVSLISRYKYLVRACGAGEKGEFSDEIIPNAGKSREFCRTKLRF